VQDEEEEEEQEEEEESGVLIRLAGRDLISNDWLSTTDPLVSLTVLAVGSEEYDHVGTTERQINTRDPDFDKRFLLPADIPPMTKLRLNVDDVPKDDSELADTHLLGVCDIAAFEILELAAAGDSIELPIINMEDEETNERLKKKFSRLLLTLTIQGSLDTVADTHEDDAKQQAIAQEADDQLREFKTWFGVQIRDLVVEGITSASPADKTSLSLKDKITSVNGQPLGVQADFRNAISGRRVGDVYLLGYQSQGSTETKFTEITVGARGASDEEVARLRALAGW
jgi:hypothetical protein